MAQESVSQEPTQIVDDVGKGCFGALLNLFILIGVGSVAILFFD